MNNFFAGIIAALFSIITMFSNYAREGALMITDDCSQFRNGKFQYRSREPGQPNISIERKDSIQIETNLQTGETTKLSVEWKDNCTYRMRLIESTFNLPDSVKELRKHIIMETKILNWTKDYYLFEAGIDNNPQRFTDTLWISK